MPAPYPIGEWDLANRVAILGAIEGWVAEYTGATYRRWFEQGLEPGVQPNLTDSLSEIKQDANRVLPIAVSAEISTAYESATDQARKLGIFGSPTFAVDGELFWGDDRLDDAIAWHHNRTLATCY